MKDLNVALDGVLNELWTSGSASNLGDNVYLWVFLRCLTDSLAIGSKVLARTFGVFFWKGICVFSSNQKWGLMSQCLTNTPENFVLCDPSCVLHVRSIGPSFFGEIRGTSKCPWQLSFKVQLTEQQRLLGGNMHCKQHVMPPHDIVASLYEYPETFFPLLTGEPGRIDHYWTENMDLYRSLNMPDLEAWLPKHLCFRVFYDWGYKILFGVCVLVRISILGHVNLCASAGVRGWGWRPTALWDHDNFANTFVFIINPRLPSFMCRPELWQDNKRSPESYPPSSGVELWIPPKLSPNRFTLFSLNGWSFIYISYKAPIKNVFVERTRLEIELISCHHWGLGVHPHQDPWDRPFTEEYFPDRWLKAGQRLSGPFTYVLDGVQGDADFISAMFQLNRPWSKDVWNWTHRFFGA